MRKHTALFGGLVCLVALALAPSASARERLPRPAYTWVTEATLIVAGRVESVDADSGTLLVTRTLAGKAEAETITFAPTANPECWAARPRGEQQPPDVAVGDELALFLTKTDCPTYRVIDGGWAMVGTSAHGPFVKAPLKSVEYLVAAMRTADIDARDHAMLAAAVDEEQFLRRAACSYVRTGLGVAAAADLDRLAADGDTVDRDELAAAPRAAHLAAVRKMSPELAALVRIERGSEPSGAALAALADARCAPEGEFENLVKFARAVRKLNRYEELEAACRVIACYDRADAVDAVVELAGALPRFLSTLGQSDRPEARAKLLAELHGKDDALIAAATNGLADRLARGRDEEIESALFARLTDPSGPQMHEVISLALMRCRALDVANILLDRLAAEPLTTQAEDGAARALSDYVAAQPPIAGLRKLVVARQDVLIRRLDAGKTQSVWPLRVLHDIATAEGRAAIRHAAASHPDPGLRDAAERFMDPVGK